MIHTTPVSILATPAHDDWRLGIGLTISELRAGCGYQANVCVGGTAMSVCLSDDDMKAVGRWILALPEDLPEDGAE